MVIGHLRPGTLASRHHLGVTVCHRLAEAHLEKHLLAGLLLPPLAGTGCRILPESHHCQVHRPSTCLETTQMETCHQATSPCRMAVVCQRKSIDGEKENERRQTRTRSRTA